MRLKFIQNIIDILRKKVKYKRLKVRYKNAKQLMKDLKILKLHLGCGTNYIEGWINIDNNSDHNIERLDLKWDLRKPLPFKDDSIDFIFNEHFIEHLTVEEAQKLIKEFLRVLKPGAVMRIAMPDLEKSVASYLNPNWKEDEAMFLKKFNLDFIETRAEKLNIGFRWWGHKWLYDWEELDRRLKQAGCSKLQNLETRKESTLIAEVIK